MDTWSDYNHMQVLTTLRQYAPMKDSDASANNPCNAAVPPSVFLLSAAAE